MTQDGSATKPNDLEHELGASARLDVEDEFEHAQLFAEYRERILAPFVRFAERGPSLIGGKDAEAELRSLIDAVRDGDL